MSPVEDDTHSFATIGPANWISRSRGAVLKVTPSPIAA